MEHRIKIELKDSVVNFYYWRSIWWVFGQWIPYSSSAIGNSYEAYKIYYEACIKINPFFKNIHKK